MKETSSGQVTWYLQVVEGDLCPVGTKSFSLSGACGGEVLCQCHPRVQCLNLGQEKVLPRPASWLWRGPPCGHFFMSWKILGVFRFLKYSETFSPNLLLRSFPSLHGKCGDLTSTGYTTPRKATQDRTCKLFADANKALRAYSSVNSSPRPFPKRYWQLGGRQWHEQGPVLEPSSGMRPAAHVSWHSPQRVSHAAHVTLCTQHSHSGRNACRETKGNCNGSVRLLTVINDS